MSGWELITLLAMAWGCWFILEGVRVRELAVQAARQACMREQVQFLDETVMRAKFSFARNEQGRLSLRRLYQFEYSVSGNDRYPGSVAMLGKEVELVEIAAHGQGNVIFLNKISEK